MVPVCVVGVCGVCGVWGTSGSHGASLRDASDLPCPWVCFSRPKSRPTTVLAWWYAPSCTQQGRCTPLA